MTPGIVPDLLGTWELDPADEAARARFGEVVMEFHPDGSLTYVIHEDGKKQIILLRCRIERDELVTNQPSAPREDRTRFGFTEDGRLFLDYDGFRAHYVRRGGATA